MNDFITQAQEAARQWSELNTAFFHQQAQLFQAPWSSRAVLIPDASAVMAGFVKALASADEFMVKAVRLLDVQCAQLLAAALKDNAAQHSLAPFIGAYKSASQAAVAAVEQLAQSRMALLEQIRAF